MGEMTEAAGPWHRSDLMKYFHQNVNYNLIEGAVVTQRSPFLSLADCAHPCLSEILSL
jgi:hypothetical protein